MSSPPWSTVSVTTPTEGTKAAWMCATCKFVVGGAGLESPPQRCPMCAVAAGEVVAVVPSGGAVPKMMVLDRRITELMDRYRSARDRARRYGEVHDELADRGNYELDGSSAASDENDVSSREHRAALALADATLERSRDSRSSMH